MKQNFTPEQIESLKNCESLKKQFAAELYRRTPIYKHAYITEFEAAQTIAKEIYPFSSSMEPALYIAREWTKDKIVIDTYLQIKETGNMGFLLPTKEQLIMSVSDLFDSINNEVQERGYSKRSKSKEYKRLKTLREAGLDSALLLNELMGWNCMKIIE